VSGQQISRRRILASAPATVLWAGLPGRAAAAEQPGTTAGPGDTVVVRPADPRYPALVVGNNTRWQAHPDQVVLPTTTEQVARAVQDAVRSGRRLTVRSGGHCYENFVYDDNTRVVLDLSLLDQVDFDPAMRAFTVRPGAKLSQVYDTLLRHWSVTIPGGSCPSVGAGGHIMGGGYGLLSRLHGLTVDHLYAVEVVVVDQDGTVRTVVATREDGDPNRDLWWAHTGGGGGNFGVVTKYWLRSPNAIGSSPQSLLPQPPATVLVNMLGLDWASMDRATFTRLVRNFGHWHEANSAPDSPSRVVSSILALNHRSAGALGLLILVNSDAPDAGTRLAEFRAAILDGVGAPIPATGRIGDIAASPELAQPRRLPWLQATRLLGVSTPPLIDPTLRGKHKAAYFRRALRDEQAGTLYDQLTRTDVANPASGGVLFGYGGQVNAAGPDSTAVAQRDSVQKMLIQSFWSDSADDPANIGWVRDAYAGIFPDTGGVPVAGELTDGCYINYPDVDLGDPNWNRSGVPWQTLYYGAHYPRLQQVKARWDPLDTFHHAQSIRLPGS
jgi:FAD/FMN-containing dehydrogenase